MSPCNCKKKSKPLGATATTTTTGTTTQQPFYSPGRTTQSFSLQVGGSTRTYGSRLEYDAARKRAGL